MTSGPCIEIRKTRSRHQCNISKLAGITQSLIQPWGFQAHLPKTNPKKGLEQIHSNQRPNKSKNVILGKKQVFGAIIISCQRKKTKKIQYWKVKKMSLFPCFFHVRLPNSCGALGHLSLPKNIQLLWLQRGHRRAWQHQGQMDHPALGVTTFWEIFPTIRLGHENHIHQQNSNPCNKSLWLSDFQIRNQQDRTNFIRRSFATPLMEPNSLVYH